MFFTFKVIIYRYVFIAIFLIFCTFSVSFSVFYCGMLVLFSYISVSFSLLCMFCRFGFMVTMRMVYGEKCVFISI
uniref:Uncharacterized protein n=1 Tax=Desmodus rotundus TaxID=9430 RepID=K9IFU8_DESRO